MADETRSIVKRALGIAALAVATASALCMTGLAWYAFSAPPVEHLALAADLVAATSTEGVRTLSRASARTDYDQLVPEFVPQSRRAYCGVATSVAVINAAHHGKPRLTQQTLFTPAATAVRGELAVSFNGLTLEQLARIIRTHGMQAEVVHAAQSSLGAFRDVARTTLAEPSVFLVVNYDRSVVGQEGAGHISPVGAYDSEQDRVLVLDVAAHKYPFTWIPLAKLWEAMSTTDPDSGTTRGYLLAR